MRRFIYRLLLFASPFLLLLVLVLTVKTRPGETTMKAAFADEIAAYTWSEKCDSVYGLILGSSSLRYGLSATAISEPGKRWLNFSFDARDPVMMYLLLTQYYDKLRIKSVIVGFDPWIYAKHYYKSRDKIMYLDLNGGELFRFMHNDVNVLVKKARVLADRFAGKYDEPVIPTAERAIPPDYGSVKLTRSAVNFNAREDFFEIDRTGWSDLEFEYLGKINSFCKAHGIKVVYVFPPKRSDFVEAANTKFKRDNFEWWTRVNEVIPGATVLGRFDILKDYNQASIFAEAYHLNAEGQQIYSAYIKQNLDKGVAIAPGYHFISGD